MFTDRSADSGDRLTTPPTVIVFKDEKARPMGLPKRPQPIMFNFINDPSTARFIGESAS